MKHVFFCIIVFAVFIASCQQSSAPANTSIDTGFQQTPLVTATNPSDSLHNMDTSVMIIDSMSNITFNGAPMEKKENNVYNAVYNNWLQAYQSTQHLPVAFKLVQQGTVMMGIRGNIGDALLKAQNDMKNYIAKDKYRKSFAQLSGAEKDSLQQSHPILFNRPF